VVSAREPFDIPQFQSAKNVIAIYGDTAVSMAGARDVIFFGVAPQGRMPVAL
jgi:hypothetical protein